MISFINLDDGKNHFCPPKKKRKNNNNVYLRFDFIDFAEILENVVEGE